MDGVNGVEHRVCQGSPCSAVCGLFCEEAWNGVVKVLSLSPRQAELARRVLAEQSDDEIARALDLPRNSISSHVQCLSEKLQVNNSVRLLTKLFGTYLAWSAQSSLPAGCPRRRWIEPH